MTITMQNEQESVNVMVWFFFLFCVLREDEMIIRIFFSIWLHVCMGMEKTIFYKYLHKAMTVSFNVF